MSRGFLERVRLGIEPLGWRVLGSILCFAIAIELPAVGAIRLGLRLDNSPATAVSGRAVLSVGAAAAGFCAITVAIAGLACLVGQRRFVSSYVAIEGLIAAIAMPLACGSWVAFRFYESPPQWDSEHPLLATGTIVGSYLACVGAITVLGIVSGQRRAVGAYLKFEVFASAVTLPPVVAGLVEPHVRDSAAGWIHPHIDSYGLAALGYSGCAAVCWYALGRWSKPTGRRYVSAEVVVLAILLPLSAAVVTGGQFRSPPDGWSPTGWLWIGLVSSLAAYLLTFAAVGAVGYRAGRRRAACWYIGAEAAFVLGLLVLVIAVNHFAGPASASPRPIPAAVPDRLDVLVVARQRFSGTPRDFPPDPFRDEWNVRFSVAVIERGAPAVVATDASERDATDALYSATAEHRHESVSWRKNAQRVIVLDPDDIPPTPTAYDTPARSEDDPTKWDPIVAELRPIDATVIVVLRDDKNAQIARWRSWAAANEARVIVTSVVPNGGRRLFDYGVVEGTTSVRGDSDRALAYRFRPWLFMDNQAPDREKGEYWPVDVTDFFSQHQPKMCRSEAPNDKCPVVSKAAMLDQSYDVLDTGVLRSTPRPPAPGTFGPRPTTPPFNPPPNVAPPSSTVATPTPLPASTIPAPRPVDAPPNVAPPISGTAPGLPGAPAEGSGPSGRYYYHVIRYNDWIYLDYWWFFPFNPSAVFIDATCQPYSRPELTCFDHASDWEGVTVKIKKMHGIYKPLDVVYDQHGRQIEASFPALAETAAWKMKQGGEHAIVYVASGSHASYAQPCSTAYCPEIHVHGFLPDSRHNGRLRWGNNGDDCNTTACLRKLPTTADGSPALWNAWQGLWGRSVCILHDLFCTLTEAPRSPSRQKRYCGPLAKQLATGRCYKPTGSARSRR